MQNMYADMMKQWAGAMKAPQMPQMPQMPNIGLDQVVAIGKRNMEACSEAASCLTEGLQTVARRQADIARKSVENLLKTSKDMLVNGSPEINTAKQAEFAKSLIEQSVNNIREVSELCTKSSMEAFDVFSRRTTENFEEIGGLGKARKKSA